MIKVVLVIDPVSRRGLYDSESVVMGIYSSIYEASLSLGDKLRFCSFFSVKS